MKSTHRTQRLLKSCGEKAHMTPAGMKKHKAERPSPLYLLNQSHYSLNEETLFSVGHRGSKGDEETGVTGEARSQDD